MAVLLLSSPRDKKATIFTLTHILIPWGLPFWFSLHRWRLLATSVFNGNRLSETVTECDNARACCFPRQTNKEDVCFSVTRVKKKIPCCFQDPEQRNLLFVPGTKHPQCVYIQIEGSMVSRGRHSLQLVFVLTKAFIAKVQKLTSLTRQEGDKRGPREQKRAHRQCIQCSFRHANRSLERWELYRDLYSLFLSHAQNKNYMHTVHSSSHVTCNVLGSARRVPCVCNVLQRGKHKQNINMKTIQDHMKIIPKGFFLEKKIIWIFWVLHHLQRHWEKNQSVWSGCQRTVSCCSP